MKNNKLSGLGRAKKYFKRRRFSEVIRILEPQVFTYRENPTFYYLLGVSCLNTNDLAGSTSYLKRVIQLDKDHLNARLALAVIYLKKMEAEESIRLWLEILDDFPGNKIAKKGLDLVRENASPDKMIELAQTQKVNMLIPSTGFYLSFPIVLGLVSLFSCTILLFGGLAIKKYYESKKPVMRPEISAVIIEKDMPIIDSSEKAAIMLSEPEIKESFKKIKQLLEDYHDNIARKEINKILLSNASRQVKERVKIFIPHIKAPNFTSMDESFTFQEVVRNIQLYSNCYIRWKGRLTNLKITEKEISFDFLVGYQDQKVLEGIIPAKLDFSAKVEPSFAYEILAQIIPTTGNEKAFSLKITSLHELGF